MSDYYSLPTTLGAAKLAAAANNNQALTLSHMAFGDANGIPYLPTSRVNATNLVNERYRVAVQFVVQDTQNPNVYIIKARIPANIGGFDVNEIGIFDTEGELIYLANYPRTFKPQITQGAGGELTIKLHVMTSHTDIISIILDPHVITLTQDEGDNRYALKTELADEIIARENGDLSLSIALSFISTALGQAQNTITQISDYTSMGPNIWGDGYYKFPEAIGGIKFQFGRRVSGAPDAGSITFPEAFSTKTLYIGITPLYDQNITEANAAVAHVKTYGLSGFTYSSGIEAEGDDVFHASDLNFLWFALGF